MRSGQRRTTGSLGATAGLVVRISARRPTASVSPIDVARRPEPCVLTQMCARRAKKRRENEDEAEAIMRRGEDDTSNDTNCRS